jgi:putative DNA primase/helicase
MRDLATMEADVTPDRVASSSDSPAGAADVARLQVRLDEWQEALRATNHNTGGPIPTYEYAEGRFGLTHDDMSRLGLGHTDTLPGGPRLVVPFRDVNGVARGYQARALDPDAQVRWYGPKSPDGATWTKVGYFPGGSGWDEVLICEGPGDALTGAALGYDTIGIRGAGLASNPNVVSEILAMVGDREAVICGDGDPAGRRFSAQLADALAANNQRVRVLDMPDGMDLTDWRAKDPARFTGDIIRAIATSAPIAAATAALMAWDEDRYSLTDLGGARYLRDYIQSIGSGVKYTDEAGFFLLDAGVWRKDERQAVRTHAQDVADLLRDLAKTASIAAAKDGASGDDKKRAARLNRYAAHIQTTRGLDSVLRELQAVAGVPASIEDFDKKHDLLAARNGVINLRTGQLQPHDANLLLTRRVDVDYDPNARAPRWEQFLREVFPMHRDLPAYMQRLIGYGITGYTSEQCFAVLWGTGANGKSVFTDTLTEVFRELSTTTPFSTFEDRASGGIPNDLAALKGARLTFAAEGEQGRPMAEAVLKRVTGRDEIAARFMRKEFFSFRPTFLLLLATNFQPQFRGQDDGLWRRVKLIPWQRFFAPDERDHRLPDVLLGEMQGIVTWAVQGAQQWFAGGLQDPDVIRDSTKEYRETSDILAGFLPGVLVADPDAGVMDGNTAYQSYTDWAAEENLPAKEVLTRRTFYGKLGEKKFVKKRTAKGIGFEGLRRARYTDAMPETVEIVSHPVYAESDVLSAPRKGASLEDVL